MEEEFDVSTGTEGEGRHQDDSDPVAGLRKATQAEREKRQTAERRAQELEVQVAELRGRADGMATSQKPKTDAQSEWTAAQLRQAVEEGRLSEDQADDIKLTQAEKRIRESVTSEVRQELTNKDLAAKVDQEISRYKSNVPDMMDPGSAARAKLQSEFNYLVSMGHGANDARTEVLAARAAFGPVEALEKAGTGKGRETWQESGGSAEPGGNEGGGGKDAPPKDMPAKNRDYYRSQISKGVYKDWAQVKEEWNYKPKHNTKARTAA